MRAGTKPAPLQASPTALHLNDGSQSTDQITYGSSLFPSPFSLMCEMHCCTASASNPITWLTHLPFMPARQVGQPEGRPSCNSYIPSHRRHQHGSWTKNPGKLVQRLERWAVASSSPDALGSVSPDSTSPISPQNSVHWMEEDSSIEDLCYQPPATHLGRAVPNEPDLQTAMGTILGE